MTQFFNPYDTLFKSSFEDKLHLDSIPNNSIVVMYNSVYGSGTATVGNHKFIVYKEESGRAWAWKAGPDTEVPSERSLLSKIQYWRGHSYNSDFADHPSNEDGSPNALREVGEVIYQGAEGESLLGFVASFNRTIDRLRKLDLQYDFLNNGTNSNTIVDTLLKYARLQQPQFDNGTSPLYDFSKGQYTEYFAPGSNRPLNLTQLEQEKRQKDADLKKLYDLDIRLQANASVSGSTIQAPVIAQFANLLGFAAPPEPFVPNDPADNFPPDNDNLPDDGQPPERPWAYNPDFYVPDADQFPDPEEPNNGEPPVPEGFNPDALAENFAAGEGANEVLRRDPLFLDLDGDGVETLSITQWYGYKHAA
jgi:hypothetical protein